MTLIKIVVVAALGGALASCRSDPPPVIVDTDPPVRQRSSRVAAASAQGIAPLVAASCALMIAKQEDGLDTQGTTLGTEQQHLIAFRNRCKFPIRVVHAIRPNGPLTTVTDMLAAGETSRFTRIEDAPGRPGYAVCSYANVPASYACRASRGR